MRSRRRAGSNKATSDVDGSVGRDTARAGPTSRRRRSARSGAVRGRTRATSRRHASLKRLGFAFRPRLKHGHDTVEVVEHVEPRADLDERETAHGGAADHEHLEIGRPQPAASTLRAGRTASESSRKVTVDRSEVSCTDDRRELARIETAETMKMAQRPVDERRASGPAVDEEGGEPQTMTTTISTRYASSWNGKFPVGHSAGSGRRE